MKKYISAAVVAIFFAVGLPQVVSAQQTNMPTPIYCLGSCPTGAVTPSGGTPSTSTVPSSGPGSPMPTGGTPLSLTPVQPTINPCQEDQSTAFRGGGNKSFRSGGGFFQRFFEFLLRIIEYILRLIMGDEQMPSLPGFPTPTPSGSPSNPNPCPSPTTGPGISMAPSNMPSTGPSTTVPSTTSGPAPTTGPAAWCTNPVWQSSDPNGMWENGGYFVHNNMWNGNGDPQTTYACSFANWYVTSTQSNDAGAVKTYPNSHKDYNRPLNSFSTITSTYQHETPNVSNGIWNVAYDVWLNGLDIEVMIWTDNFNQRPSGSKVGTQTFGGRTWEVWKSGNSYFAFVQTPAAKSGTVNIREMLDYGIAQGWFSANVELYQIGYGVEVVSTNGQPATFKFTNFSITP